MATSPKRRRVASTDNAAAAAEHDSRWSEWLLSTLPTGSFAHSAGLESAMQRGIVHADDRNSLVGFVVRALEQVTHAQLPFVRAAWRDGADDGKSGERWAVLDRQINATLCSNQVAAKASTATGTALLRVAAAAMDSSLQETRRRLRTDRTLRGHHAPLFGLLGRQLGLELAVVERLFLFGFVRDIASAATRLALVGPVDAAVLQAEMAAHAARAASTSDEVVEGAVPAWQTDPVLDVVQSAHDQLYSRLFIS